MFVCICNAITDHQIKEAINNGANSLSDLTEQLGVANCCGCCAELASSFLPHPTQFRYTSNKYRIAEHRIAEAA